MTNTTDTNRAIQFGGMGLSAFGFILANSNFMLGVFLAIVGAMMFMYTLPINFKQSGQGKKVTQKVEGEISAQNNT